MQRSTWKTAVAAAGTAVLLAFAAWAEEEEVALTCEETCNAAEETCNQGCDDADDPAACEEDCRAQAEGCLEGCE
jgi:hypothetical protein